MTQQFPFLFQYLKKQRINIDRNEFDFQVQSHPSYPSLLSISDTLSFFKINNIAARPESTHQLPDDFIALLNNEGSGQFLAFVEKKQNGYRYTKEQKATDLSVEDFNKMFEDIVLVAESSEKATLKPRKRILSISLAILSLLYLAAAFAEGFNLPVFMFILLASAGLYLSIQAVSHELGINTKFSEAFCSLTEDTDCDAVINSVKSNFFAFLNFSNISISFFAGQLFSLLLFSITGQLQSLYDLTFISLLCSLPVTAISIYMQIFIVKKWCPLCLSIIFLLFAETASLFFLNDFSSCSQPDPLFIFL